jgi:hypothetical protein
MPSSRANPATTALSPQEQFLEGFPADWADDPPVAAQPAVVERQPSLRDQVNGLREEINGRQPDAASRRGVEPSFDEMEDPNQFTAQLLPDTAGFEVPKTMPPMAGNGNEKAAPANLPAPSAAIKPVDGERLGNGGQKPLPAPGSAFAPEAAKSSGKIKPPVNAKLAAELDAAFNNNDEHIVTDELEIMLDKTIEKTTEAPMLSVRDESLSARTARPLPGFLSVEKPIEDMPLERVRRNEWIALTVAAIIALIGLAIFIWLFFVRSMGRA